jgi:hypothetical protein
VVLLFIEQWQLHGVHNVFAVVVRERRDCRLFLHVHLNAERFVLAEKEAGEKAEGLNAIVLPVKLAVTNNNYFLVWANQTKLYASSPCTKATACVAFTAARYPSFRL